MLQHRYGLLSNRELASRIGLLGADAPVMLSSALSGHGTRHVRCAIALALDALPSQLWPHRRPEIQEADDKCYTEIRTIQHVNDWAERFA